MLQSQKLVDWFFDKKKSNSDVETWVDDTYFNADYNIANT
jgi:hypothetical protein